MTTSLVLDYRNIFFKKTSIETSAVPKRGVFGIRHFVSKLLSNCSLGYQVRTSTSHRR